MADDKKASILNRVGLFLVCAAVVFGLSYLIQIHLTDKDAFDFYNPNEPGAWDSIKENWVKRLELSGVPNFHKVSEKLYRGAQPTAEGMQQLKNLGVKTIVNLRSFHSDQDEIQDIGLDYEHIYMKTWHPEDKEVLRFLRIVTDPNRAPVFVHCKRGADRTGTMCAIYRIAAQNWSKNEAIKEMTKGEFWLLWRLAESG